MLKMLDFNNVDNDRQCPVMSRMIDTDFSHVDNARQSVQSC